MTEQNPYGTDIGKLFARCDELFNAKYGRDYAAPIDEDIYCIPHSQEEAEWLMELSDKHYADMLEAWGDKDANLTIWQWMGDDEHQAECAKHAQKGDG